MSDTKSILWNDSTPAQDKALVKYLVENIVAGKSVTGHYDKCVAKIMTKIKTAEWQASFPQRTHVFSIYYGISIKSVVEIKFSLHAQALELFYFNVASTNDDLTYDPKAGFHKKLQTVFEHVYKWKLPSDTSHAIRILRNDVMHTGTVAGVKGAYRSKGDPERIKDVFLKYEFDKNQLHSDVQNRIHLSHLFNLLVEDMLIRSLGLNQDDLAYNGAPIWNSTIFGYDHDNRPGWLRTS